MIPLTSLPDLETAVRDLPPVAPGKVRVFRGQTADYPGIVPAAFRTHLERNKVWFFYSRTLLLDITLLDIMQDAAASAIEQELQVWTLWLQALAQHYGSGSRYLDVSHSMESAAWFALHKSGARIDQTVMGPPGPASPFDMPGEIKWLTYSQATEPGYFYAFDVDVWDGVSALLPDLSLVDLSHAPEPFVTPRMLAQHGCLIAAGAGEGHDLRKHCVPGTPLRIAWPMSGSSYVRHSVEEMFPSPELDPWYRRFLRVPMDPAVDPKTGRVLMKRILPVTLYLGETDAYNAAINATEAFLYPPLIHKVARQGGEQWGANRIADAAPIVLEAPLLKAFAPAGSDLWNHELLLRGIAPEVMTYDAGSEEPRGVTGTANVLFQFSNFEELFWERSNKPDAQDLLVRGVWLCRSQQELIAVLICQQFPGTSIASWSPARIRLDPGTRRLQVQPVGSGLDWAPLSTVPILAKPVIIALQMLRALSPAPKPEASPGTSLMSPEGNRYVVRIVADAARLVRAADPAQVADWYVMRDAENEPYTEPKGDVRSVTLRDPRAFADIEAATIEAAISGAFAAEQS
jgi:hypothetical protein